MGAMTTNELHQYLTFKLGEEIFALDIARVREVLEYTTVTALPRSPDFVRGVINLRGSVVPVVDLRLFKEPTFAAGNQPFGLSLWVRPSEFRRNDWGNCFSCGAANTGCALLVAEVGQDLSFDKPFNLVCTGNCIATGRVDFEDLGRLELFNGLDQAGIQRLCLGILADLSRPVFPESETGLQHIWTAAENNDPVAGEQVCEMPLDKAIHRNKFVCPSLDVDDPGIPLLVHTGHVRFYRVGEMDHGMTPAGQLGPDQGLTRARRPGNAAHHSALITCRNRSFSQSSPMLTRM